MRPTGINGVVWSACGSRMSPMKKSTTSAAAAATTTTTSTTNPFNGLFSRTTWVSRHQKGKTFLELNEAREWRGFGMQWQQLDHIQTICTSLQTNHTNIPSLNFYRPDALPDAQPTVSPMQKCLKRLRCRLVSRVGSHEHKDWCWMGVGIGATWRIWWINLRGGSDVACRYHYCCNVWCNSSSSPELFCVLLNRCNSQKDCQN